TENWARKIYWPREVLQREFTAIVAAQQPRFPQLAEKADWLLFGSSRPKSKNGQTYHVYFKSSEARNPGVLGLRWPRFDNRGPALDAWQPVDDQGRPLHVVRKNKEAFTKAQWELALMNFRVQDTSTRQKRDPQLDFPVFIENLRSEWNKKGKVTFARLKKLAEPFKDRFLLLEDQKPLTPDTGSGRARYSSPTLERIRSEVEAGRRADPPQPVLRRAGETADQALNRYLADIKHPLVRHRLVLFRGLLQQLVSRHGPPDMLVLEAVRSLALGQAKKNELSQRNEKFRQEREQARQQLSANHESYSRKAIQRYRLWQEAKARCPFCLHPIARTDLGQSADIEHLVPRSIVDCNEIYNLTVAHLKCNRELKGDRTPLHAFGHTPEWEALKANAEFCFTGRKLEIFLSPNAEDLIEQKADLQHTAYIARVIRHVSLVQLGWLSDAGRDPTPEKQNPALKFQVTNGQLTSRLRRAWGLNQILHPLPPGCRWDELTAEEQQQFTEKNRGDLRHHALDAMVIACTLPWLAHRTHGAVDALGRHGWWTQDEKQRSKAANRVFPAPGQMHEVVQQELAKVVVRHHVSRSNHQRSYDTTIYGRPTRNGVPIPDCYVAREPITSLKPADLKSLKTGKSKIFPPELGDYLALAWKSFCEVVPDWERLTKANKANLPVEFQERLCFSDFQRWRAEGSPPFRWPEKVIISIKRVGYIGVEDDNAVAPASPKTHGFVARGGRKPLREVRLHPSADGTSLVPVFIPAWRLDKPIPKSPVTPNSDFVAIIRRGQTVEIINSPGRNTPAGKYRVASTMQQNIKLLPLHLADRKDSLKAAGFLENGVNISWDTFIKSAGYELPHPPPIKPQPEGPD
ncbi:MAG: type II CRISPR RNA-guided endonuclease Cas9, partial [Verrucomicrobiota bacterium]